MKKRDLFDIPGGEKKKSHIAEMLRQLVIEHKKNCMKECSMSMFLIYENFYKPFLGEEEARKNFKSFM